MFYRQLLKRGVVRAMAVKKNKSGMTIVEVVIAMTIIAISTGIMCSGISTSLSIIRKSSDLIKDNAENKSSLFENIADNKTENINKTGLEFNGKNYDIYEVKSENDSGELRYYSTQEATLNTRGLIQCFIESYEKLSSGDLSGVVLTKNSIDYSENSDASNAFKNYLNDTYGIDANDFYWRILRDSSDGTYKIALTDGLKSYISDGSFVKVNSASVKIGSTNYSNVKSGYCQFKNIHPSSNSFNGGSDYLILNTVKGPDVDADTFLTSDDFNTTKNGSVIFNLFDYLCVSNSYTGNVNSDNCPDIAKNELKNRGIDLDKITLNFNFNGGSPIISYCDKADKSKLKNNDYVLAQNAEIANGVVKYSSGFTKIIKNDGGMEIGSELVSMDVFDDDKIFEDSSHASTIKNMFSYFMLEKRISDSIDSENASDEVKTDVKMETGIDSENALWKVKRDKNNDNLMFKYSTVLPLSEMKYGDNYKKYSDILIRTISAEYNFEKNKWSYSDGYSQLKYIDGLFVISDNDILLDDLSDEEVLLISAIENGRSQNGNIAELDGESGYTIEDDKRLINDTLAGKIIENAKTNFNVDLDKYYWKVSDNGDLLTFVKKSDVSVDSDGNPDISKNIKANQIKISKLKKTEQEVKIALDNNIYILSF